ncbi:MAG: hypothetical protein ACXABN_16040 [Candidatus Thorarchaeota archaeon]
MSTDSVVSVSELSKKFGKVEAFRRTNLEVRPGIFAISFIVPLVLFAMIPVYDSTFSPNVGYSAGGGVVEPGATIVQKFETAGGHVKGNVTVDISPIRVWIIPRADYNSTDLFSTYYAIYNNVGTFSAFDFDSSIERDLVLIIINNNNDTQRYDYIIEYEFPLDMDNVIYSTQDIVIVLVALVVAIVYLIIRRRD